MEIKICAAAEGAQPVRCNPPLAFGLQHGPGARRAGRYQGTCARKPTVSDLCRPTGPLKADINRERGLRGIEGHGCGAAQPWSRQEGPSAISQSPAGHESRGCCLKPPCSQSPTARGSNLPRPGGAGWPAGEPIVGRPFPNRRWPSIDRRQPELFRARRVSTANLMFVRGWRWPNRNLQPVNL
jgi:hypothetical protein